jgi:ribulose-phosphate 3-epimerase
MTKIAPSLLSADFSKFGEEVKRIEAAGADWAHIDVMDGVFVDNITIGPSVIKSVRSFSKIPFDVHLMIVDPGKYIKRFVDAGADMLTIHEEIKTDKIAALKEIKDSGLKVGMTLNPKTPVHVLDKYLDMLDLVLIMTVQAGFGGQPFQEIGLSKIEYVREYSEAHNPHMEISVDGGINRDTGKRCVDAGATVLAAGSSLFGSKDMPAEIALWKKFGPDRA